MSRHAAEPSPAPSLSPGSPSAWQRSVGEHIARALRERRLAHAPAGDAADAAFASRWQVPLRYGDAAARGGAMFERCLQYYREQLRPADARDDAGVALACFIAACIQAQTRLAATAERVRAVHRWIDAWVADGLDWESQLLGVQQDFFERLAVGAVAVGEWAVVASRQGETQMASARWFARTSLAEELGLSLDELAAALPLPLPRPAAV